MKIPAQVLETNWIPDPPPAEPTRIFRRVTLSQLDASHHPKVAQAIEAAHAWRERRTAGEANAALVLIASPIKGDLERTGYGCGKTHIARACLHTECLVAGDEPVAPTGKFFEANAIIQRLDSATPASVEISGAGIVVIDDLGTEQNIPYVAAVDQAQERANRYYKLINYAYERGVSLIITGNLTPRGLAERIGGRAWSRLCEMAPRGQIVDLTGVPDWRRRPC